MLLTALFIMAKKGKKLKCLSIDKWIKNVAYLYNGIVFSSKMKCNSDMCLNMGEP